MLETRPAAPAIPPFSVSGAYAGTIVYPPGGRFGPRIQPDLQLVLLHTGSMEIHIDDRPHQVEPGRVALLKPGHKESFQFARDGETWHRWIAVGLESMSPEAAAFFESLPFSLPISDEMNRLTDLMLSCKQANGSGTEDPLTRTLGLSALLLYEAECRLSHTSQIMHPAILIAKHTVQERYAEDISLEDIAQAANVSSEHLIRLFRQYEQCTPIRYLWEYRVRRSIDLLRGTGLSIGEISERCGFKTSYHYARTVKRVTGSTPTELRQKSWSG